MWTSEIDPACVVEIRTRTSVYLGAGAIRKIDDILKVLKNSGTDRLIIVTGKRSYKTCGAWNYCGEALANNKVEYVHYSDVTPNPTVDQVDHAVKLAKDSNAQAVLSIGGGSPIDAAKSVAILMKHTDMSARDLYGYKFSATDAAPIIAINTTHGTGTETNRFAVVSIPEKKHKPYIANDHIYPLCSIDDPSLMVSLPTDQTAFVSIDAINHVVEACTSKAANPYSVMLAKETINLVAQYLPIAQKEPQNVEARYYLAYASMIAGVCFDNGLLHYTHALEHPLSGVEPTLAHGLGLALILPSVVKKIYSAKPRTLAFVLGDIVPNLKGEPDEAKHVFNSLNSWLSKFGIVKGLSNNGFDSAQIERLISLVYTTPGLEALLDLAPNYSGRESVEEIYADAM